MAATFRPDSRRGLVFHVGSLILNFLLVVSLAILALSQSVRGFFIIILISAVILFLPLPVITYRLLTLLRGKYTIDRDGLYIEWGLRTETIPMYDIEWIRSIKEMAYGLGLPPFSFTGMILGTRAHRDLGEIEFIASEARKILLIATQKNILAISPNDPAQFTKTLQRYGELGTISPIKEQSSRPNFLVNAILADKTARSLILIGAILSLLLLVITAFIIPSREVILLGFDPNSHAALTSPSERLLLLPILSMLTFTLDLGLGAYVFRKEGIHAGAYLIFGAASIAPLSFLGLILFFILPG